MGRIRRMRSLLCCPTSYEQFENEEGKCSRSLTQENMSEKRTNWTSLWFSNLVQFGIGLQLSLYFTSMWPYLTKLDPTAKLTFFGWILASFSIGQAVASPIFGSWTQWTKSYKFPIATGLVFCSMGHALYAVLPTIGVDGKWLMLVSRVVVGVGSGNLSAFRAYTAAASTREDRNSAVATSIASYVTGMIAGPVLQVIFALLRDGFSIGAIIFDQYTCPAFVMVVVNLIFAVLVFHFFEEKYAGIIEDDDVAPGEDVIIPKFDRLAAALCIYLWFLIQTIAVNIETMCSPFTIAMYDWSKDQAVVYNGIIQTASCAISVVQYGLIAYTRVSKIDRRIQIVFGLIVFAAFYIVSLPLPFYNQSLHYIPNATESGCPYDWCKTVPRVPLIPYVIVYIICFGLAFPYIGNSIGTLFSEVLGPRQQGTMQGIFALVGSIGRCLAPLVTTEIFARTGYTWISVETLVFLVIGGALLLIYWDRMVALEVTTVNKKNPSERTSLRY